MGEAAAIDMYFLSFTTSDYSRSSVLFNFESKVFAKTFVNFRSKSVHIFKDLLKLRKEMDKKSVIVVMSPSHKITFFARLMTKNLIVLDAGWPLTDGVLSRGNRNGYKRRLFVSYLIDFVSFHSSHIVLVETSAQRARVHKLYFVPSKKLHRNFTGYNETSLLNVESQSEKITSVKNFLSLGGRPLTVLFRGKINRESGIEVILKVASKLQNSISLIVLTSSDKVLSDVPINCHVITDVSTSEMAYIYSIADITLGQLSSHPRLAYTIPHKAFESGFFSKSYLTYKSRGIRELYDEDSAVLIRDLSVENICAAIKSLSSRELRSQLGTRAHNRYKELSSQKVLNNNFEKIILTYYSK